jgi:hypothetical protein
VSSLGLTVTFTVEGAVMPDSVTVSHGEFDVTVNGTALPLPDTLTWNDCDAGLCVEPSAPLKFRPVEDSVRIALLVTTNVTGIEVNSVVPDVPIVTVVL